MKGKISKINLNTDTEKKQNEAAIIERTEDAELLFLLGLLIVGGCALLSINNIVIDNEEISTESDQSYHPEAIQGQLERNVDEILQSNSFQIRMPLP